MKTFIALIALSISLSTHACKLELIKTFEANSDDDGPTVCQGNPDRLLNTCAQAGYSCRVLEKENVKKGSCSYVIEGELAASADLLKRSELCREINACLLESKDFVGTFLEFEEFADSIHCKVTAGVKAINNSSGPRELRIPTPSPDAIRGVGRR
jgi:hypothetical protein